MAEPDATKVLLVIGHGRRTGLCHHLAGVALAALRARGIPHRVHDLLADGFDPRLELGPDEPHATACDAAQDPVAHRYQTDVRWADAYVVVHPVWWFAPPAILKGWIDRVLVHDVAIRQVAEGSPEPLLGGRRALVVQTFQAPRAVERVAFRGITSRLWRSVVFPSIGVDAVEVLGLHRVAGVEPRRLRRFEQKLEAAVARLIE
jgi:putative NADPH-quinone reductase